MTALATISPRLDPLIRRLSSDSDGEIVACVRAIHRQLERQGLSFHDLADLLPGGEPERRQNEPQTAKSPAGFTSYLAAVMWLLSEHSQRLTPKEYAFLMNMVRTLPRRSPSRRQATWIIDLVERYRHG